MRFILTLLVCLSVSTPSFSMIPLCGKCIKTHHNPYICTCKGEIESMFDTELPSSSSSKNEADHSTNETIEEHQDDSNNNPETDDNVT